MSGLRTAYRSRPVPGPVRLVVFAGLAPLVGVAAGLGAMLGAATATARPPLFLATGLGVFCLAYLIGLLLATRALEPGRRRRTRGLLSAGTTAVIVGVFALTAVVPMDDPRLPPAPVAGQRF